MTPVPSDQMVSFPTRGDLQLSTRLAGDFDYRKLIPTDMPNALTVERQAPPTRSVVRADGPREQPLIHGLSMGPDGLEPVRSPRTSKWSAVEQPGRQYEGTELTVKSPTPST